MGLFFNNQDIANAGVTEKAVLYSRSRFSWEPSEIRAAKPDGARLLREAPAAFGRLRVETRTMSARLKSRCPAAFGRLRVETIMVLFRTDVGKPAAFGRLRVETMPCVLLWLCCLPAAFGRLRVETACYGYDDIQSLASRLRAAAF